MRATGVRKSRWRVLAAIVVMMVTMQVALQVATATPAAAVPGLERVFARSDRDSSSAKRMIAECPAGKRVVGGGGEVHANRPADRSKVMLTSLVPSHIPPELPTDRDRFVVAGREIEPIAGDWSLVAFAICADPVPGFQIVGQTSDYSSSTFKHVAAGCPRSKRVLSTGATVMGNSGGKVGLQLTRPDRHLTIARATARETTGHSGQWALRSYAICVFPIGATITGRLEFVEPGEIVTCPAGTSLHGPGGGGSLTDITGAVFLQSVWPTSDLRHALAQMSGPAGDGMVVTAVCAP